jgi:hypothetical protein
MVAARQSVRLASAITRRNDSAVVADGHDPAKELRGSGRVRRTPEWRIRAQERRWVGQVQAKSYWFERRCRRSKVAEQADLMRALHRVDRHRRNAQRTRHALTIRAVTRPRRFMLRLRRGLPLRRRVVSRRRPANYDVVAATRLGLVSQPPRRDQGRQRAGQADRAARSNDRGAFDYAGAAWTGCGHDKPGREVLAHRRGRTSREFDLRPCDEFEHIPPC